MSERAEKRLPVTETTKKLIDEVKDDKKPYDLWLREDSRLSDVQGDGR